MAAFQRLSTWVYILVLLLCWFVIRLDVTPAPVRATSADTAFNVSTAFSYLTNIAREPHSLGTPANDSVRDYLMSSCKALGLDVAALPFEITLPEYRGVVTARGTNIAATLRGSGHGKKILVVGHYDSQPNSLGAGDDGSACAAMLETARALRAGAPLPVDVLFLFTSGEEEGLLGAEAFSRDSIQIKDIGLILNFDARGDKGVCLMFRTSADNRWIIPEFARAEIHHNAGSLYSELFKFIPNNTDFSPFLKTRIPGFDFAFAEGFTAYHNRTDNIDNIDKKTIQEEGDNMIGMIRHFTRIDLDSPRSAGPGDATYFDLIYGILIHYPPSTGFICLLLANAFVIFALVFGIYKKQIRLTHTALGLLLYPLTLIILYFLTSWSLDALRAAWPLYFGYYPNAYNAYYFYLALAAETVGVFALLYMWPLRKRSIPSLFIAVLLLLTILLDFCYRYIPGGIYFLCFPLIGSAAIFAFLKPSPILLLLCSLPAILFLAPLSYSLAELFDVQPQAAIVAPMTALLLGLLIPLFSLTIRETPWLIPGSALAVMLLSIGFGVLHGSYNSQKPLKTDLRYVLQPDQHQAWWVSRATRPDRWNRSFFTRSLIRPTSYWYPVAATQPANELFNPAPYLDLPAPMLVPTLDTLVGGHRRLYLHCRPAPGTTSIHMSFNPDHPADNVTINGNQLTGPLGWLEYHAPPDSGFDLIIGCPRSTPFTVDITARTMGLPAAAGFHGYPEDVIPTADYFANTTMVQRSYIYPPSK